MILLLDIAINPVSNENARIILNEHEGGKSVIIVQRQLRKKMITPDDPEMATIELHEKSTVQQTVIEQQARHDQRTITKGRNVPLKNNPRRANATIRKSCTRGEQRVDLGVHNLYVVETSFRT